ncbi:uncharacterized protein DUF4244 [Sediminihabitans luteus]|uniref:Uncharacterized protein DUF4244 n=1 Tax=Sediminihabitans luteus TaxID=1138585 RepID=A0A2M9D026_9CELL|nr:DUF4244 domain-containing protein [Sediminihabitans luteus]PJJ77552.1 uncharacterized protein DUF4244 [Sediminihabitans luteus]GII98452.1 hypothetical protein Slu03_08300 [Sediminihabitans luteus]
MQGRTTTRSITGDRTARLRGEVARRWRRLAGAAEQGMATAEYAVATVAAVGFAGLLIVVLKSNEVRGLLLGIVRSALSIG